MKIRLFILILALFVTGIYSCHKGSNDPAPSSTNNNSIDTTKSGGTGNTSSNPVPVTLRIYRDMDESWFFHPGAVFLTMPGQAEKQIYENHTTQFTFCGTAPDMTFDGYKDSLYTFTYRVLNASVGGSGDYLKFKVQLKITDTNCAYLSFCGENSMNYIGHSTNVQSAHSTEIAVNMLTVPLGGFTWIKGDAPLDGNEGNPLLVTYPTF